MWIKANSKHGSKSSCTKPYQWIGEGLLVFRVGMGLLVFRIGEGLLVFRVGVGLLVLSNASKYRSNVSIKWEIGYREPICTSGSTLE